MAVLPMAVFLCAFVAIKLSGAVSFLSENSAEASALSGAKQNKGLLGSLHDWRDAKVVRTSLQYKPEMFYEMNMAELEAVFGEPTSSRKDGEARMVQYVYAGCAADFYYLSGANAKISHYEIRQLPQNTSSDCLTTLLQNL